MRLEAQGQGYDTHNKYYFSYIFSGSRKKVLIVLANDISENFIIIKVKSNKR